MSLTAWELRGKDRPERGPYPKGVVNGPDPTTKRGERRRSENVGPEPKNIEEETEPLSM